MTNGIETHKKLFSTEICSLVQVAGQFSCTAKNHGKRKLFKTLILSLLLVVAGCGGGGGSTTENKTPTNQAPRVTITGKTSAQVGEVITLEAIASDSDGSVSSYRWSQSAGTQVSISSTNTPSVSFAIPINARGQTLSFSVVVTDDDSASTTATTNIVVESVPAPVVNIFSELNGNVVIPGGKLRSSVSVTSLVNIVNVLWTFPQSVNVIQQSATEFEGWIESDAVFPINLVVSVEDELGQTSTASMQLTASSGVLGHVVDDPLRNATIHLSTSHSFDTFVTAMTDADGFYQTIEFQPNEIYFVRTQGGFINDSEFTQEMKSICFLSRSTCHVTPWSTILADFYSDNLPTFSEYSTFSESLSESLFGQSAVDPFIEYWLDQNDSFSHIETLSNWVRMDDNIEQLIEQISFFIENDSLPSASPLSDLLPPGTVNTLPEISVGNSFVVDEQSSLQIEVTAQDFDQDSITFQWSQISGDVDLVFDGSLRESNAITLEIPAVNSESTVTMMIKVFDSQNSFTSELVTIKVNNSIVQNQPPEITLESSVRVNDKSLQVIEPVVYDDGGVVLLQWREIGTSKFIPEGEVIESDKLDLDIPSTTEDYTVTFELTATDSQGLASIKTIEVSVNSPPTLVVNYVEGNHGDDINLLGAREDQPFRLDAQFSFDSKSTAIEYEWSLVSQHSVAEFSNSAIFNITVPSYSAQTGAISYLLKATDDEGAYSESLVSFPIMTTPLATINFPRTINAGENINLNASIEFDGNAQITKIEWDVKNGNAVKDFHNSAGYFEGALNEGRTVEFVPYLGNVKDFQPKDPNDLSSTQLTFLVSITNAANFTFSQEFDVNIKIPFAYTGEFNDRESFNSIPWNKVLQVVGDIEQYQVIDFDGNGINDVLFSHTANNQALFRYQLSEDISTDARNQGVSAVLFDAEGGFELKSVLPPDYIIYNLHGVQFESFEADDFDNDGDADLIVTLELFNDSDAIAYLNEKLGAGNYNSNFLRGVFYLENTNQSVDLANKHLIYYTAPTSNEVYEQYENADGTPNGNEPIEVLYEEADKMQIIDIDLDGDTDLLAFSSRNRLSALSVFKNDGNGLFDEPIVIAYNAQGFASNTTSTSSLNWIECVNYEFVLGIPIWCDEHNVVKGDLPDYEISVLSNEISDLNFDEAGLFDSQKGMFDILVNPFNSANSSVITSQFQVDPDSDFSFDNLVRIQDGSQVVVDIWSNFNEEGFDKRTQLLLAKDLNNDGADDIFSVNRTNRAGTYDYEAVILIADPAISDENTYSYSPAIEYKVNPPTLNPHETRVYPLAQQGENEILYASFGNLMAFDVSENSNRSLFDEPYNMSSAAMVDVDADGSFEIVRASQCNGNLTYLDEIDTGIWESNTIATNLPFVSNIIVPVQNPDTIVLVHEPTFDCYGLFQENFLLSLVSKKPQTNQWETTGIDNLNVDGQNVSRIFKVINSKNEQYLGYDFIALAEVQNNLKIIGFNLTDSDVSSLTILLDTGLVKDDIPHHASIDLKGYQDASNFSLSIHVLSPSYSHLMVVDVTNSAFSLAYANTAVKGDDEPIIYLSGVADTDNDNELEIVTIQDIKTGEFEDGTPIYDTNLAFYNYTDGALEQVLPYNVEPAGYPNLTRLSDNGNLSFKQIRELQFVDINHDGYVDYYVNLAGTTYYLLNDKQGGVLDSSITLQPLKVSAEYLSEFDVNLKWVTSPTRKSFFKDMNGDGLDDLIRLSDGIATVEYNNISVQLD